jgi:hypothetical protein
LDIARFLWLQSGEDNAPLFLVLDGILSHCTTSPAGWRPVDWLLREHIPNRNWVFSQNTSQGHRHLELSEEFGAYFVVAETNPRPCLHLMGAADDSLAAYKRVLSRPREQLSDEQNVARRAEHALAKTAALAALWDWLSNAQG